LDGRVVAETDNAAALVDYAQIDGLLEAAGKDGVDAILCAFWRSTDSLAAQLKAHIDCRDFVEAARASHAVKGSAANVGAHLLSSVAREVETCCKNDDPDGALAALNRLLEAYRRTRAALTDRVAAFG
jgi:HPt (histidine-containing phosphotransfer) domain-containing protein